MSISLYTSITAFSQHHVMTYYTVRGLANDLTTNGNIEHITSWYWAAWSILTPESTHGNPVCIVYFCLIREYCSIVGSYKR